MAAANDALYTLSEADASDEKRVERSAAHGEGEKKGDGLFADHTHGSVPCFVVVWEPDRSEGERGMTDRA